MFTRQPEGRERLHWALESSPVQFDWDDANTRHVRRHRVMREELEQCYRNDPLVIEEQLVGGEARYLALGETDASRRLAFVFTVRDDRISS